MIPSLTQSSVSHCVNTSAWIRSFHVDTLMKSVELAEPVIGKKLALQETRLLKSTAGEPAIMPSKSSGNSTAELMPCRPPKEQPR